MLPLDTPPESLVPVHEHPLLRRVQRSTLYRYIFEGRIETLKLGRVIYTTDEAVRAFVVASNEAPVRPRQPAKTAAKPTQAQRRAELAAALKKLQGN